MNKNNHFRDVGYIPTFREKKITDIFALFKHYTSSSVLKKYPYLNEVSKTYDMHSDKDSKNILPLLWAFKIMGKRKVRLPLYN
jgi:hypothetical protein